MGVRTNGRDVTRATRSRLSPFLEHYLTPFIVILCYFSYDIVSLYYDNYIFLYGILLRCDTMAAVSYYDTMIIDTMIL